MFGWFKKIFSPELMNERLDEIPANGKCPDCGKGTLYEGPQGGAGVNVMCDNCLSEFVVLAGFRQIICRNGKITPERARTTYGVEV